jgi:SAM-dependent methyltransferase
MCSLAEADGTETYLEIHPAVTVTVSDRDPTSVANIAAGKLGTHPRARTQVIDATAIDAEDDSYDLVVFAQAFHHLPPGVACQAIVEATRVGKRFLVIDLQRQRPLTLMLFTVLKPVLHLLFVFSSSLRPLLHDGFISALRAYSPAALEALGNAADPALRIEFLPRPKGLGPRSITVLFSRPGAADHGWRPYVDGVEHRPADGRFLLVGNHTRLIPKPHLKVLNRSDYPRIEFTDTQSQQLDSIFPTASPTRFNPASATRPAGPSSSTTGPGRTASALTLTNYDTNWSSTAKERGNEMVRTWMFYIPGVRHIAVAGEGDRAATESAGGHLDILVNNAATLLMPTPTADIPEQLLRDAFAVNVFAPFLLTGVVAPGMARNGKGSCPWTEAGRRCRSQLLIGGPTRRQAAGKSAPGRGGRA